MELGGFFKNLFGYAKTTIAILFVLVLSVKGYTQPYSIDSTFGPNGLVTGSNCITGVDVIFSGNKYYMIGSQGLYVINYDGTLDTAFGSNGFISLPTTSYPTYTVKNAKINGDFIYLFGQIEVNSTNTDGFIAKFNLTTGTPDVVFGPNGIKTIDYGANESSTDILFGTSPGASFYFVMTRSVGSNNATTYIIKMFADGTLDTSFDPSGYKTYTFQLGLYSGQLFNYEDGLLLTGLIRNTNTNFYTDICLVNLSTDGSVVTSFGTNGIIVLGIPGFGNKLVCGKLTSDNKLYVCYWANELYSAGENSIIRYDLNTNVRTNANYNISRFLGQFSLASDGKVYFPNFVGTDYAIVGSTVKRFNENLTLDTSFNITGSFSVNFTNYIGPQPQPSLCRVVYSHDDGKIFIGGNPPSVCTLGARRIVPGVLAVSQFEKDTFSIVPNPVTDYLEITRKSDVEIEKIAIADITGKIVLQKSGNFSRIDAQVLQSGLYFLEVYSGNDKSTMKFIKR